VRTEVDVLVHHVDERALDEIGELKRAAKLPVALDAFMHRAGDLDEEGSEFLRDPNLRRAIAISL
jgi:hypothetical protein